MTMNHPILSGAPGLPGTSKRPPSQQCSDCANDAQVIMGPATPEIPTGTPSASFQGMFLTRRADEAKCNHESGH